MRAFVNVEGIVHVYSNSRNQGITYICTSAVLRNLESCYLSMLRPHEACRIPISHTKGQVSMKPVISAGM